MNAAMEPQVRVEDGPLGRWVSGHWCPPALAHAVRQLWTFDGSLQLARERVFPDGTVQIIVQLGARYRSALDSRHGAGFPALCLNGLRSTADVVEAPPGRSGVIGLHLTPLGAHALLRGAQAEACGLTLDLEDVLGPFARALADALADAATPAAQLRAAAGWIAARLRDAPTPDTQVAWVCAQIEASRGSLPIGALCERAGLSPTRLPARFRAQVGVTPKHFARIARFRHALSLLTRDSRAAALADVAAEVGYADQPHFNAEFRAMAGMSPGAYLRARRYPHTVSLAEAGG